MKYLLDTDICVYWLRGDQAVHQKMSATDPNDLAVSIITVAELHYGADCSEKPEYNHKIVNNFVNGLSILNLEQTIACKFGEIKTRLRQKGTLIEDFDLLIAAIALNNNLVLVTNNVDHFTRIEKLQIENWKAV
jgi:tRNA(fMet)-specific endonuclease VapC